MTVPTRRCSKCGDTKPLTEFPLRRRDTTRRQPYCRACKAIYQRLWYERNRARHIANVTAQRTIVRQRNQALIRAAKLQPCADCGASYPAYVMDFDHVRGVKRGNVSEMASTATSAALLAEIAKCDVVCANCHRERTYGPCDPPRPLVSEAAAPYGI